MELTEEYLDTRFMGGQRTVHIHRNVYRTWIQRERLGIVEIELPCTLRGDDALFNFYQR
jgi:hypothetical protein